MIIKAKLEGRSGGMRTMYYMHTSNGHPICGSKNRATNFPPDQAKKVLEHLQIIDARFSTAELVDG